MRVAPRPCTWTRTPWDCAYLLRGSAVPGINEYMPRPTYVEGEHMPFRGAEECK